MEKTFTPKGERRYLPRPSKSAKSGRGRNGFSLTELLIALSVGLVAATIATMAFESAVRSVRLSEAGADYANLLQTARVRAVRDDKYYSVLMTISSTAPPTAFVDIAGTGTYGAGDPRIVFPEGVTNMAFASGPALANLESQFLPPGANSLITINTTTAGPTFGPRGLPCSPTPGAAGSVTCPSTTPTSYITFIQNQENTQWEAITVTPAGRVREWTYDNYGAWSPRN